MQNQSYGYNLTDLIFTLQSFCEDSDKRQLNKDLFSVKFKILFAIKVGNKVSPSVLVNKLKIAKSNIALFCKSLLKQNLILSKQDEVDRRVIYYCLTPQGEEYVDDVVNLLNEHICQNVEENKLKNIEKYTNALIKVFSHK